MLKVKPKHDLVFKSLFGDENDKRLLTGLLRAILDNPHVEYDEITIKNPIDTINYEGQKTPILDIKLYLKSGKWINIEIQTDKKKYFKNRSLHSLCKLITNQVKRGDKNYTLSDTIVILICDFIMKKELTHYHNMVQLFYVGTDLAFSKVTSIHVLELPKLPREHDGSTLWDYLKFIQSETEEDLQMVSLDTYGIKAGIEKLQQIIADEDLQMRMDAWDTWQRDQHCNMMEAREEGHQEGLQKGERRVTFATAKAMLIEKIPVDIIVKVTGLTKEQITSI